MSVVVVQKNHMVHKRDGTTCDPYFGTREKKVHGGTLNPNMKKQNLEETTVGEEHLPLLP